MKLRKVTNQQGLPMEFVQQEVAFTVVVMPPFDLTALKGKQVPVSIHLGRTSIMGVGTLQAILPCSMVTIQAPSGKYYQGRFEPYQKPIDYSDEEIAKLEEEAEKIAKELDVEGEVNNDK